MSHKSSVLSYSECKIAKSFQGFAPGSHCREHPAPDSPVAQQKIAGYGTAKGKMFI